MMNTIITPSRIHINSIDMTGNYGRIGLGFGIAINEPRFCIDFEKSDEIIIEGLEISRAKQYAEKLYAYFGLNGGIKLNIYEAIPPHVGLGSGTQLALAIGLVITQVEKISIDVLTIAKITGRSYFSGVGMASFFKGGFTIDSGYPFEFIRENFYHKIPIKPLINYNLPENWRIILAIPERIQGFCSREIEAINIHPLIPIPRHETQEIAQIVLSKLLPSIVNKDFMNFSEAIRLTNTLGLKRYEIEIYGEYVHKIFEDLQNYNCAFGMSSAGPTIYIIVDNPDDFKSALTSLNCYKNMKIIDTIINNSGYSIREKN